jgi:ribonucleoside-diphosphate reductase alpha chain
VTLPERKRLPAERRSVTRTLRLPYSHKDGSPDIMRFFITVGLYDDGSPGEVFIKADKTGSVASGALDAVGILMSLCLQHGIPLETITSKLRHMRFMPSGFTKDPELPSCSSPLDFVAQFLDLRFGKKEEAS